MTMPLVPPFAITGAYQHSQMATGTYFQGGSQVFSKLVNPPVSGVAAELASDDAGQAAGYVTGAAVNEVQTVTVLGTPTGGSFPLTFGAQTATILYNEAAAAAQTKLRALSKIGPTGVAVTGGPLPGAALICTFNGVPWAGKQVPRLSATTAGLTGGTNVSVGVAQTTPGHRAGAVTPALNPAIQNTYQQRDPMVNFYDSASGNHA